ncbi:MAG: adenylosuccinate lyase [Ruegeria sp.]
MFRTLICALALGLTTSAAFACTGHTQQTQSCTAGTIWDSESQSCVKAVNS